MAKYTVTALDTTGIQSYIFGSNRLQENIGASELVRLATGKWALEALPEPNNVADIEQGTLNDDLEIEAEAGNIAAEVIYSGGGNAVIIFRSKKDAIDFTRRLTRKVLKEAPGLSIVVAHYHEFEWNTPSKEGNASLSQVVQGLVGDKLNRLKAARMPSLPMFGLGVTAACESTGLIATRTDEGEYKGVKLKLSNRATPPRLLSREVAEKLYARDLANKRLEEIFEEKLKGAYRFPFDIDKLGRIEGEESYVAVVHADGNGMGKHIEKIADGHADPRQNRDYIKKMRNFSRNVNRAASEALNDIVLLLAKLLERDPDSGREMVAGKVPIEEDYLPFRPLVFGGDDVTFICNAQLGLSLAAEYLTAYEKATERYCEEKLYACAGIAMVKMHYPFARAYALSDELVREAKKYVRKKYKGEKDASALDWHFATSGLSGSLKTMREREYELSSKPNKVTLLMRPLLLRPEDHDQDGRAWFERIEKLTRIFQNTDEKQGEAWGKKRNKVKALREAVRGGGNAVGHFIKNYRLDDLPEIVRGQQTYRKTGFAGGETVRCGYFDAIELYDHYVRLEAQEDEE